MPSLLRSYVPSCRSLATACLPAMAGRPVTTADELLARGEANGYKRGEYREKDAVGNRNIYMNKTK